MVVSAVPEGSYADVGNGLRMHYHEAGSGHPVVFVHGSGPGASGWSNFKGNYEVFAEAGYHALVPDLIGYGYSSHDEDLPYSWEMEVDALKGFLDAKGLDKVTLVGNSMGGAICIQLALDHPDRVENLIMMAPGGIESRETYMGMKGIRTMLGILFGGQPVTRESMRKIFELQLYDRAQITDEIIEERFQVFEILPKGILGKIKVPNLRERLGELQCPVFGLWGQDDLFCPVSGVQSFMEACSHVRFTTISECGHWVMVEHAELFNRLCLDFLKNG